MKKENVKIRLNAMCLSCCKSTLDSLEGKLLCEVEGIEVEDEHYCGMWECNYNLFDVCGLGIEGVETPSLFEF